MADTSSTSSRRHTTGGPTVGVGLTQCWHRVPGGTAVAALHLVEALVRRARVEVWGVGLSDRPPTAGFEPTVPTTPLVPGFVPPGVLYEAWRRCGRPGLPRAVRSVDLFHLTAPVPPPTLRVPLVATLHDVFPLRFPQHFSRHGAALMTAAIDRLRERATLVCCSSESTRDDCEEVGFDPERLRVVPLGVRPPRPVSPEDEAAVLRRHGLVEPFLLWVGTAEPRKNLAGLLAAYRLLAGRVSAPPLVLVGPRGWGESGLPDVPPPGVRALGPMPRHELEVLFARASMVIQPSLAEGFGLPALEAMVHGTPVITSTGTATEEVGRGAAELVDPRDPEAIAAAVDLLLHDESRRSDLRAAGLARAADFTWDRTALCTEGVYREALSR